MISIPPGTLVGDEAYILGTRGFAEYKRGNPEIAISLFQRAIRLRPLDPILHGYLALSYLCAYRMEEAIAFGLSAIRLDPSNIETVVSMALIWESAGDRERAAACLRRALDKDPDHALAQVMVGNAVAAEGDLAVGLAHQERSRRVREINPGQPELPPLLTEASPHWEAEPAGRLFLIADQGHGDVFFYSRYIRMAAERCRELVIGGVPKIVPSLAKIPGVTKTYTNWVDLPEHDAHCRLSSLPFLFKTRLDTIPATVPYLTADPARVARWRDHLAATLPAGVMRIGLNWVSNSRWRTVRLATLLPLADAAPAAFISLQTPLPACDLDAVSGFPGMTADPTDFLDAAALIANLDLVITVDTSIAHLAGALGAQTWTLISQPADWRWLLNRTDSPWYPTMRLFRQRKPGAWEDVVAEVAAALRIRFSHAALAS